MSVMSHFHAVLDYPDEDIDDFSLQNYAALLDTQIDALEQLLSTCQRGQIVRNGVKSVILGRPPGIPWRKKFVWAGWCCA